MAKATKEKANNTINIKSLPVQCHVGASKYVNDDWGTIAFSFPRNQIQNKFADKELRYNFIYFLFGYEGSQEVVYVGQAKKRNSGESVLARLREHDDSTTEKYRDKWAWVIAVTNKDDAWGLDDLNALEHAFYNEIPADQNLNGNNPNAGGADYEAYVDKINQIKSLITAIGFRIFADEETSEKIQVTSETNDFSIVEDLQNGMARIPEIVTPQKVVKAMVDMLPPEVWNSKTTFLDPACKGGEYLREIYDRLMDSEVLQSEFPNTIERSNHILKNQIYGIALSQVSLERTAKKLLGEDRNIKIIPNYINRLKGIDMGSRPDGSQRNIMDILNKEFGKEMRFDVVIGNPPYNEASRIEIGSGDSLYGDFMFIAKKIGEIVSLIVPSGWMLQYPVGEKHDIIDDLRENNNMIELVDYLNSAHLFNGVTIPNGVCIYVAKRGYEGKCKHTIVNADGNKEIIEHTLFDKNTKMIFRDRLAIEIINHIDDYFKETKLDKITFDKVCAGAKHHFDDAKEIMTSVWNEYSVVETDEYNIMYFVKSNNKVHKYNVTECTKSGIPNLGYAWVSKEQIPHNADDYKRHKIIVGQAFTAGSSQVMDIPQYIGNNSVCSQSYIPIFSPNDSESECLTIVKYIKTKFFRYLVSCVKTGQNLGNRVYQLVPIQDFTSNSDIDWSQSISEIDKQLYKKYNLTDEEISYIEQTIKPMQ